MKQHVQCLLQAAFLVLGAQTLASPCLAGPAQPLTADVASPKEEAKKIVYRNWKSIKPCIKLFVERNEAVPALILRFKVEPESKIGGVSTSPSDPEVEECFKSALWTMDFQAVDRAASVHLRIDLADRTPAKEEKAEKEPEEAPGATKDALEDAAKPGGGAPAGSTDAAPGKRTERFTVPKLHESASGQWLLGGLHGPTMSSRELRVFLLDRPSSAELAKKSRALEAGGIFLQVFGPLAAVGGAFLLGFGLNYYLLEDPPASRATVFTASGACMLAVGIALAITGRLLYRRNLSFFIDAVNAYNAAGPEAPASPIWIAH